MLFTDCDLDGIGTALVFKWFVQDKNITHEISSLSNFRKTFTNWSSKNKLTDFDRVYIFDLDVSQDCLDLIDHENVTVIDHHDTHIVNKDKYKNAKTILIDETSCCKLLYSLFKKKYPEKEITDLQKLLILMVDDYDCYELKLKDSYNLNVVLWNYVGNRAEQFTRDFYDGFGGFNAQHKNIIHFNQKKLREAISELQVYAGYIPINKKKYKIVATTTSHSINEIAHHIIDKYDGQIGLVLNPDTKKVSFRKNKETAKDVDLGLLANKLAEGGGHEYSSGGRITENIISLTKLLNLV